MGIQRLPFQVFQNRISPSVELQAESPATNLPFFAFSLHPPKMVAHQGQVHLRQARPVPSACGPALARLELSWSQHLQTPGWIRDFDLLKANLSYLSGLSRTVFATACVRKASFYVSYRRSTSSRDSGHGIAYIRLRYR